MQTVTRREYAALYGVRLSEMSTFDLADQLRAWPYDPDNNVRVVQCPDGREVLQVRQPLGIEQYEMDGRPDGERPYGEESALAYHLRRFGSAKERGKQSKFSLSHEDCVELINEGTLYYFRYVHLFQIQDWERTARDTGRNIRLFDLISQYADDPNDGECLEQWRPYIVRMNAVARAMGKIEDDDHSEALAIANDAIETIEGMPDMEDNATFKVETQRSLEVLRSLTKDIERNRPKSEIEQLEQALKDAVAKEEYERAARLRDEIREKRPGAE